jgi:hypothetical protein
MLRRRNDRLLLAIAESGPWPDPEGVATSSSSAATSTPSAAWQQLARVTGLVGIASVVLIFVPIVAMSGEEPDFRGSAAEALTFFRSIDSGLAELGRFVTTVGMLGFLWFAVGITTLLRRAEGEPHWRSTAGLVSAVVVVPLILEGSWDAATHRAADLEPQVARYAFDVGNLSFTNAWVALGSFAIACGWVLVSTGYLARWLGWLAVVSGVGLVLARAVRLEVIWFVPYLLFWVWVVAVSVLLLRRGASAGSRGAA